MIEFVNSLGVSFLLLIIVISLCIVFYKLIKNFLAIKKINKKQNLCADEKKKIKENSQWNLSIVLSILLSGLIFVVLFTSQYEIKKNYADEIKNNNCGLEYLFQEKERDKKERIEKSENVMHFEWFSEVFQAETDQQNKKILIKKDDWEKYKDNFEELLLKKNSEYMIKYKDKQEGNIEYTESEWFIQRRKCYISARDSESKDLTDEEARSGYMAGLDVIKGDWSLINVFQTAVLAETAFYKTLSESDKIIDAAAAIELFETCSGTDKFYAGDNVMIYKDDTVFRSGKIFLNEGMNTQYFNDKREHYILMSLCCFDFCLNYERPKEDTEEKDKKDDLQYLYYCCLSLQYLWSDLDVELRESLCEELLDKWNGNEPKNENEDLYKTQNFENKTEDEIKSMKAWLEKCVNNIRLQKSNES